jgi:transcription initiation factor TFIIH subunit 2
VACSGEPSLQNALELALRSLHMLPSHASREILILMGSLTTCDPGDISVTVQVSVSHQDRSKKKTVIIYE